MAKALDNLKKDRDFKKVVTDLFINTGKASLWENIKHLEEMNMQSFNEGRAKTVEKLKKEVNARLALETFFDLIEADGESAQAETE